MDELSDLPGKDIREKMINFIRKHYTDTLGDDVNLLEKSDGLEKLHRKYCVPKI
jgi:hypothetical protein